MPRRWRSASRRGRTPKIISLPSFSPQHTDRHSRREHRLRVHSHQNRRRLIAFLPSLEMPTSSPTIRARLGSQVAVIGLGYALGQKSIRRSSLLLLQFFYPYFRQYFSVNRNIERQSRGACVIPTHFSRAASRPSSTPKAVGGEALTLPVFAGPRSSFKRSP
jgi:hypothetical protein